MQREIDRWRPYAMRFAVCVGVALVVAACSRPPDEVRIRDAIAAMQKAAEARHADGVLDHIADDFTGQAGEVNRAALARMLKIEFLRKDGISVALGPISIAIDGDRAVAKFEMTLGDVTQRWLPSGTETYAVVSGWRREGNEWICYNASW
jgi:ketosteroid isomerase-like protein